MAWTAPRTWVAAEILTADMLNEQLRDNLLETMPAKAKTPGAFFVTTEENVITERISHAARIDASETTASTSFTDLATVGPSVTVETGTKALIVISAEILNDNANAQSVMSWTMSGASNRLPGASAVELTALISDGVPVNSPWGCAMADLHVGLTPGITTFTATYRAGGAGTARFQNRFICVFPF